MIRSSREFLVRLILPLSASPKELFLTLVLCVRFEIDLKAWLNLRWVTACDLVGFHIEDYCANFIDCCQRRLGCRVDRSAGEVEFDDRKVHVRALPIGIPFGHFEQLALKSPKVLALARCSRVPAW